MVVSAPVSDTPLSHQQLQPVSDDITMSDAPQSPAKHLIGQVNSSTKVRLVPCTEAPSITSSDVIVWLNRSPQPNGTKDLLPTSDPRAPTPLVNRSQIPYASETQASQDNINTWARKIQASIDRKLKTHTSPSYTEDGTPRVKIHDSVFQRGDDLHKDFVIGVFMGKTPSFGHIQSVLTDIWDRT